MIRPQASSAVGPADAGSAAHRHSPFPGRGHVDGRIPHAARHQQPQVGQALQQAAPERRAFPHDADDLEPLQPLGQSILVIQVIVKNRKIEVLRNLPRAGQGLGDVLIIIQDSGLYVTHLVSCPMNVHVNIPASCRRLRAITA